jgi:hypothetical protein
MSGEMLGRELSSKLKRVALVKFGRHRSDPLYIAPRARTSFGIWRSGNPGKSTATETVLKSVDQCVLIAIGGPNGLVTCR